MFMKPLSFLYKKIAPPFSAEFPINSVSETIRFLAAIAPPILGATFPINFEPVIIKVES